MFWTVFKLKDSPGLTWSDKDYLVLVPQKKLPRVNNHIPLGQRSADYRTNKNITNFTQALLNHQSPERKVLSLSNSFEDSIDMMIIIDKHVTFWD